MSTPELLRELVPRVAPRSTLLRAWPLKGGVSAHVTAFEVERADGTTERFVLRRHGERDLARNPQIAADEFRLLELLAGAGVPAPRPRLVAGADGLVVEYVDGEPPREPADVGQLAAVLAQIHSVDTAEAAFLPRRELERGSATNRPVLLHGDFWPGNTLWREGRLVGVLDWEDAAIGDPLADLANARLELLCAWGGEAAEELTRGYVALVPSLDLGSLPHWDLWAAGRLAEHIGRWGLDGETEAAIHAAHDAFVARARERLLQT